MIKRILRWLLFGGILFFLAKNLKDHWQEVRNLELTSATLSLLTVALGVTLIAHIWSGWVWHLILKTIGQPRDGRWSTAIYLKTNIAKYLPGNVWHFYGRVRALQATGSSTGAAIAGVVLEPILMAAAALGLAAISFSITIVNDWRLLAICLGALVVMMVAIHPWFLNPVLRKLGKAKAQAQGLTVITSTLRLQAYPWHSLIGELGFVALRGLGFMITIVALQSLTSTQFFYILGVFSVAWLLGLLVPGAPGGVGVFEAVAIALLSGQLPAGLLLSGVALYRLLSTLAEALGAGLIWLEERMADLMTPIANDKKRVLLGPVLKNKSSKSAKLASKLLALPPKIVELSDTPEESVPPIAGSRLDANVPTENSVSAADKGVSGTQAVTDNSVPEEDRSTEILNGVSSDPDSFDDDSVTAAIAPPEFEKPEPMVPSFITHLNGREGEPTSQSFSPKKNT